MLGFGNKKKGPFDLLAGSGRLIPADDTREGLLFLQQFFQAIRPSSVKARRHPEKNLQQAIYYLKNHPQLLVNLQHALASQLLYTDLTPAITQSGIPLARGFWQELGNRIKHKLLPPLRDEHDFLSVIHNVFYRQDDFKWVEAIPARTWGEFFETIHFHFRSGQHDLRQTLLKSLRILSIQVAQLGLEKEVMDYLPSQNGSGDSAFVLQHYAVRELEQLLLENAEDEEVTAVAFRLKNALEDCHELVEFIRSSHTEKGASLHQTYLLLILNHRLQRMQLLTDVLDADQQFDTGRLVSLFQQLVRNEKRKNSIRELLSQGVGYLAYQIAEHKGVKGHRYITETRQEYFRMIWSAMAGGFIISFVAVIKNLLGKLALAPFPTGFLYSLNYSAGFVLIDETKSTLATKQPAFTASALAASLDTRKTAAEPDLQELASTVARVSRSQIASFFGNLVIVFPLSFLLAWAYDTFTGHSLVDAPAAMGMLADQHPFRSPALLYAGFTGVFLFISGIIAGYWQNKIQYGRFRERLIRHPVLRVSLPPRRLERLAHYVEKHLGPLMGSVSLGFFLGFSGVLGKILGIPFDIRHITIAAGNTGIATYELGVSHIPPVFLLTVFLGVLAIGLVNFLVSFFLAFFMAVRSRGIRLSQYPRLFRIIGGYFIRHPRAFFLPPGKKTAPVYRPLSGSKDQEHDR